MGSCRRPAGVVLMVALILSTGCSFEQSPQAALDDADWPRFRGPNGSGVSGAAGFPVEFGPDRNVGWVSEVPFGRSSPIVVGDTVYLTGGSEGSLSTLALDRETGAIRWQRDIAPGYDAHAYIANDAASTTPASDGVNVYAFFRELGLVSYDDDGNERWRVVLGPFKNFYGVASSPVLSGDLVLLLCDQVEGSFLLAVDKETGQERWRVQRPGRIESWTTPVLYPAEQPAQVIVFGSGWIDAYDLWSGEPAWALPGVGGGPVASPVVSGSTLVVTAPNHNEEPMMQFANLLATAVDDDADGNVSAAEMADVEGWGPHFGWLDRDSDGLLTEAEYGWLTDEVERLAYGAMAIALPGPDGTPAPEIVWTNPQSIPYIASPLVYDGIVYLVRDGGIVQSVDLRTGEVFKRGRTSSSAGSVYASPVAADGKVLIASLEGELAVLQAGAQWEVLAVNEFDEPLYASPVLAGDRVFVRTPTRLFSFAPAPEGS